MRFDDGQGTAAFGRVVAGMDVAQRIQREPVKEQALDPPVTITRAFRVKR
jgi:cyclophilin family peptidyl-prolyl cis-trans isomerase